MRDIGELCHIRDRTIPLWRVATLRPSGKPMSEQSRIAQSVMEGGGAYNQHARHQTAAASAAGRFLERAVDNLVLDQGAEPIVIALRFITGQKFAGRDARGRQDAASAPGGCTS